jgi:hypothetical protein
MRARALPGNALSALFIALALGLAASLAAHAAVLRAEFNALAPRPRSQAPAPVEVKLHYQGAGLLEGVLELTLIGDGTPVLRQRTHELALTAGTQTLRLLLPPRASRDYIPTTEAHLRFVAKKGAIDLGRFPVSNSSYGIRGYLIGVCGAPSQPPEDSPRLWQILRPTRDLLDPKANPPKATFAPMMMDAEDLPASPLALCAFDLVLLEGDSFARLRAKQLAALARWTEAGGSLCVIAGGALDDEHLRFFNQFAAPARTAPAFSLDASGRLVNPGETVWMWRTELGRIVVAEKSPANSSDSAGTWAEAAHFLWKLPSDAEPLDSGSVRLSPIGAAQLGTTRPRPAVPIRQSGNIDEQRRDAIRRYLNNLLPQSTRLIPLPVVGAILGAFVLLVGPGDWYVLGWLKRRRWTWLTFPIVAAAFTALTVLAAEHYLGSEDARSTLVITDIGRGGRVLRESRLELLFAARDKDAETELRQVLAVPTAFGLRQYSSNQSPAGPPLFDGQFPARAVLRQRLRQWTPQVNRLLTFETTADNSGIRWDAISGREFAAKPNPTRWFADRAGTQGFTFMMIHQGQPTKDPDFPFLSALCILPRDNDGTLRPAAAPSGDADLADLALIADNDPDAWLAIAIKRTPGEIRIYRRLYRTDE